MCSLNSCQTHQVWSTNLDHSFRCHSSKAIKLIDFQSPVVYILINWSIIFDTTSPNRLRCLSAKPRDVHTALASAKCVRRADKTGRNAWSLTRKCIATFAFETNATIQSQKYYMCRTSCECGKMNEKTKEMRMVDSFAFDPTVDIQRC